MSLVINENFMSTISPQTQITNMTLQELLDQISEPLILPANATTKEKQNAYRRFVMFNQGSVELLPLMNLKGTDYDALFFMLADLTWGNKLHISHLRLAETMGKCNPQISRAISNLVKKTVLLRQHRDRDGVHYMLNPKIFWMGKPDVHRKALAYFERMMHKRSTDSGDVRHLGRPEHNQEPISITPQPKHATADENVPAPGVEHEDRTRDEAPTDVSEVDSSERPEWDDKDTPIIPFQVGWPVPTPIDLETQANATCPKQNRAQTDKQADFEESGHKAHTTENNDTTEQTWTTTSFPRATPTSAQPEFPMNLQANSSESRTAVSWNVSRALNSSTHTAKTEPQFLRT